MFDPENLETTEFYHHRFKNFSTRLIIPATIGLLCVLIFIFLAKREIALTSVGELTPLQQPTSVQTTTASRIVDNRLEEGKFVNKGAKLLTYHNVNNSVQIEGLKAQAKQWQKQLAALDQFKQGLTINQNSFSQDDQFGYRQALKDYLAQRQIYQLGAQEVTGTQTAANAKMDKLNQLISQSIATAKRNITAYQVLLTAIQGQSDYPNTSRFSYLYQSFSAESKLLSGPGLEKLKTTYTAQINEKQDAERAQINSLELQQTNNQLGDISQLQISENNQKMVALQASQLKLIADQKNKINESLIELNGKLAVLKDQNADFTVKAPVAGILHLDKTHKGKQYLPSGSTLAEIYPVLRQQTKAKLVLAVSPTDITSVKKGQKVRLQIARNVPIPLTLTGTVAKIDVAPTVTKTGNLFMVTANVVVTAKQSRSLHYGLSGKTAIITGEKTYFNFWKDRLFNHD